MFIKVSDSDNKKAVFGTIKSKANVDEKVKNMSSPAYFPISKNYIYLIDEEEFANEKGEDKKRLLTAIEFVKEKYSDLKHFLVFFEYDGKLTIVTKEEDEIAMEEGLKLEIASVLIFYEKYSETAEFFYVYSEKMKEIVNSIGNIYELHESVFKEIPIKEGEIDFISGKTDIVSTFKKMFNKPKKKKTNTQEDSKKSFLDRYRKEFYIGFFVLMLLGAGSIYYVKYQQEKWVEEQRMREMEELKKRLNFDKANINSSKVRFIRKYLFDKKVPILSIKENFYSTYLKDIDISKKYITMLKLRDRFYYVEGKIKTKETIHSVRELRPFKLKKFFRDFKGPGIFQKATLILTKEMSEAELKNFLNLIEKDNIWAFDIFIKKKLVMDNKKTYTGSRYLVNITIYKPKKKPSKKELKQRFLNDIRKR